MSKDCSTFREKQKCLEPGEVYIGSAGKLPYQRVFHVSIPSDFLDNENKTLAIADTLKNILRTADAIDDGIFRSIAMPLLGNVRTDPSKQLAKVTVPQQNLDIIYLLNLKVELFREINTLDWYLVLHIEY